MIKHRESISNVYFMSLSEINNQDFKANQLNIEHNSQLLQVEKERIAGKNKLILQYLKTRHCNYSVCKTKTPRVQKRQGQSKAAVI